MQTYPQAYALYVVRVPKDPKFCRRLPSDSTSRWTPLS